MCSFPPEYHISQYFFTAFVHLKLKLLHLSSLLLFCLHFPLSVGRFVAVYSSFNRCSIFCGTYLATLYFFFTNHSYLAYSVIPSFFCVARCRSVHLLRSTGAANTGIFVCMCHASGTTVVPLTMGLSNILIWC